ncbi:MAG: hypothetical protein SynsKO_24090 [Synoicihabitans sp.]
MQSGTDLDHKVTFDIEGTGNRQGGIEQGHSDQVTVGINRQGIFTSQQRHFEWISRKIEESAVIVAVGPGPRAVVIEFQRPDGEGQGSPIEIDRAVPTCLNGEEIGDDRFIGAVVRDVRHTHHDKPRIDTAKLDAEGVLVDFSVVDYAVVIFIGEVALQSGVKHQVVSAQHQTVHGHTAQLTEVVREQTIVL